jgi:SAM-dependent methyltransferase
MHAQWETYDAAAELYDIAFAWDVADEVAWLLERFGEPCVKVLEPACGAARMFPDFLRQHVDVVGIEQSAAMIRLAELRMRDLGLPAPPILHGDMVHFDLREEFDGALCPINSLGYLLSSQDLLDHLHAVARHLRAAGRYMVQLDLLDTGVSVEYDAHDSIEWEGERDGVRVRATWEALRFDAATGLQTERARFEVLTGPEAGRVVEEEHVQRKWNWEEWGALVAASPFRLAAVYAGDEGRRPVPLDAGVEAAHLTWHELVV